MLAAVTGISTIWVVIGVGWLIGHLGIVDSPGRRLMSLLAFSVASPMLLFSLVSKADLGHLFSTTVVVSTLAVAVAGGAYLLLNALWLRRSAGAATVGFMLSSYTNAANFGLPVALALLGDATWMAPILLLQVAVIQPACLVIFDVARARELGRTVRPARYVTLPVRNPITVGILLGLAVNLLHIPLPDAVTQPVSMIAATAVPLMLLAFGVSLRLDPLPGRGPHLTEMWWTVALKVVLHPLAAWLIGAYAFGLTGLPLYAVTVLGALPSAQNVYVMATRYEQRELLARDSVFWSTILSVPVLLVVSALLG